MVPVGILAAQGVVGQCGNVLEVGIANAIRLCRIFDSLNVVPVGVLGAQEGVPGAEGTDVEDTMLSSFSSVSCSSSRY